MQLRLTTLVLAIATCMAPVATLRAGDQESPIEITVPADGAVTKAHAVEVRGRVAAGWTPVVFVQPLVGRREWHPQKRTSTVDGEFRAVAYLGNHDLGALERYRICAVAMHPSEAAQFENGRAARGLPNHRHLSEVITVTRHAAGVDVGDDAIRPRRLEFSGHTWYVKRGAFLGPGTNDFHDDSSQVYLDSQGRLHLRLVRAGDQWHSSEVFGDRALGYGEYRWVVEGTLGRLHSSVVCGIFLYGGGSANEMDFELSRWGRPNDDNAQFVLQPPGEDTVSRFRLRGAERLTIVVRWYRERVEFRCFDGEDIQKTPLHAWNYEGAKLRPASLEVPSMNLWLHGAVSPKEDAATEIVIRSFNFAAEPKRP